MSVDSILNVLRPENFGDYIVYTVLILAMISSGLIPEKSQNARWVMTVVLLCCVLIKFRLHESLGIEREFVDFALMMLALGMGVLPYIAAALIRSPKRSQRAAMPLSIFTGIVGSLYVLLFFLAPDLVR